MADDLGFDIGQAFGGTDVQAPSVPMDLGFNPGQALAGADVAGGSVPGVGSGGGFSDFWGKLSGGAGKAMDWLGNNAGGIGTALKLGTAGLGAASGIMGMQQGAKQNTIMNRAESGLNTAAQPATAAAAALTPAGTAAMLGGPLPPGLQAEADQWKEGALGKYRDYFAKAGITDSTMMQTVETMVDQQYNVMKEQLAEQLLSAGNASTTAATGPLSAEAQTAATAMGGTASTMQNANKSLALLLGQQDRNQ